METFNTEQIRGVNESTSTAEELVSNAYKMSASEWLRPKYDVKTLADLMPVLKENVSRNAPEIRGQLQVPILGDLTQAGGEHGGEFVFVRRKRVSSGIEQAREAFERAMSMDRAEDRTVEEKMAIWAGYVAEHESTGHEVAKARERVAFWRGRLDEAKRAFQQVMGIDESESATAQERLTAWGEYVAEFGTTGHEMAKARDASLSGRNVSTRLGRRSSV